ncbi:hypothetical protein [Mesorhizobium abyssinicae]|uniref:hypothetical protein n=1 Tax=Mesorhizobium abyssinicae TaxID=1209958 RepID=UPI0033967B84
MTSFLGREAMNRATFASKLPIKKVRFMEALQALVLTSTQLRDMLTEAAKRGAALAIEDLRADLQQAPDDSTLQKLRGYLVDPASIANPCDYWAHSELIRRIQITARGRPKSIAWFMKFQRQTGLRECHTRLSPVFGRRREWMFTDIRLAWEAYYRKR